MAKVRILLIDDDKIVLRTIEKLLTREGYELTIAESGQKAIDIAKNTSFDLIITDIRMPHIDGLETITKIKKLQEAAKGPKSKFMIITGYADADVSNKATQMGIRQFLYKPFDRDLFLEAITSCLEPESNIPSHSEEAAPADNKALIDSFIQGQIERNKQFLRSKAVPVIGWTNTYVPEEIILAGGFMPYRIMGAPISISLSKTYLSGNLCSSVQSILECALRGDYNFLDGMIIGASTDATKRLYDAWIRYTNIPFCHLFDIPKFITEEALTHYIESVYSLIEEVEKYFKIKITESDIRGAISICNKTRKLLTALNGLRKADNPPITSQQFLEISKLAMTSNKKDFNDYLEKLLSQIRPEKEKRQGFRILLTGSFQDQPWLLDIVEERGATVVCEDLCTRLRYFSGLVDEPSPCAQGLGEDTDPIKAIAKRYLNTKPASASLVSLDQRGEHLLRLVKEFNIDGVIYYILKFDDPYLFEFPDIKEVFTANNIPVLRIETEHNTSAIGQIMTRIQAFIETLKLAKLRKAREPLVKQD